MADKTRAAGGAARWWVVQQGQDVRLVEAAEMPNQNVEPGDRAVRLVGPFADQAKAKEVLERTVRRTTRWQAQNAR